MAKFAPKTDPLMTRLRRMLARGTGNAMSVQLGILGRMVQHRATSWRSPDQLTASYWQGVYTDEARERWNKLAERIARAIARTASRTDKAQFKRSVIRAIKRQHKGGPGTIPTGRDVFILDGPKVAKRMEVYTKYAASLIKNIPDEYLAKVTTDAQNAYTGKVTHAELKERLVETLQARTARQQDRCHRIATDQVRKCSALVNQSRCEDNGIEEYIWRCAPDNLVAGKPGGKNPKADDASKFHGDHWSRNGKKFKWSNPPPDGNAGFPINCRCYAEPIITSFV